MNEILFALILFSQAPDIPTQQISLFNNRAQCIEEAKKIIAQGPSADCILITQPPKQVAKKEVVEYYQNMQ